MIRKIGIQLYSVRENFKTPEMAARTFQELKALGYDKAQTAGCYGIPYDDSISSLTMQALKSSALTVISSR